MIPHIIHFTVPRETSAPQLESIARARSLHPTWEVRVWRDPLDTEGFRLAKYWPLVNSGAQLADLIRIELISRFGGVYLDADVLLLKPLDEIAAHCEFFVASEDGVRATNAIFGAEAGHTALSAMIEELLRWPPDWQTDPTVTTGPLFFARLLRWRQDITVLPRESFYPYAHNEKSKGHRPGTYGIHLWAGSWVRPPGYSAYIDRLGVLWNWKRLARAVWRRLRKWTHSSELAIRLLHRNVDSYACAPTIVRRTIHGHSILLSGEDVSITPEVVRTGSYELREELLLRRVLRGGDFFVDVGANVGIFSLLAASLVGPFGRVYAYEPNPRVTDLLGKSAVMNWLHDRIVIRPVAVGAAGGSAQLDFAPSCLGGAALRTADRDSGTFGATAALLADPNSVSVDVVSLDAEFPYDVPIKMLKIDAEGYESEVLRGAQRLLSHRCIEYVMLEALAEVSGDGWGALLTSIEQGCEFGYQPCQINSNGHLTPVSLAALARAGVLSTRNLVLRSVASTKAETTAWQPRAASHARV